MKKIKTVFKTLTWIDAALWAVPAIVIAIYKFNNWM